VKILSAECRYEGKTPFAVVSGGTIVLKGSMSPLTLRKQAVENTSDASSIERSQPVENELILEDTKSGEFSGVRTFLLDDEADLLYEEGRSICAVTLAQEWGGNTLYLLLIKSNKDLDCYVRVGMLFKVTTTWQGLKKLYKETFKII
jgi:hypothetical protein